MVAFTKCDTCNKTVDFDSHTHDLKTLLNKLSTVTRNYNVHLRYSQSQRQWFCTFRGYSREKYGDTPEIAALKLYEWVVKENKETEQ